MIHEQRTSDQASKSLERGSRIAVICRYNVSITWSKLRKSIFYVSFLKRYIVGIKGNLDSTFYQK
jgi:hypothetical protein